MTFPTLLVTLAVRLLGAVIACAVAGPAQAEEPQVHPWLLDFAGCATPEYPKQAQREEHTGRVTLEFLIRTDGSIAASMIKGSSGYPELDEAAQEALSQCRFKLNVPVAPTSARWELVQYVWTLEDAEPAVVQRSIEAGCARAPYPAGAPNRTMTGSLALAFLVRPDGSVRATRIDRTSGYPALDGATRTALAACRFTDGEGAAPTVDEWITLEYMWSEDDWPAQTKSGRKN